MKKELPMSIKEFRNLSPIEQSDFISKLKETNEEAYTIYKLYLKHKEQ